MDDIAIQLAREENITGEILIEGLPGVGQVGKLVAEHMIDELGAEKIAEITSIYFPPQVLINEEGVTELARNEIYRYEADGRAFLFLVGDFQSNSAEGHYLLSDAYLQLAQELGVKRVYTLGGYGVGHLVDDIRVLGAVNHPGLREEVENQGVLFTRDEPGGGIIGASGLLLGLGAAYGIEGICLMGETSGYIVDPKSAHAVLQVLSRLIGLVVDETKLEERASEMEALFDKIRDMEEKRSQEELSYIG
ncbi:proteasome assembly chaperone family protein [Methanomicrobiaceae archaeon CYW5]|uniref:proteasome assembly chaperone family protein n=1 Tax=Methanovulcanius yangii TaxID=1789227 RepID=UPI0029CA8C2A|nr:proteasome assembly chaperone family protein [Methanovulcanius yangii]MBT8507192.1 proteasome assembly chaperone family protein [Methanovulcanius yangii]